jgi:hypothetical protein
MGREKKRQHFVPRFYLNTFSEEEEGPYHLYCYDKPEDNVFGSNTRDIAQSEFFYDLSEEQSIENIFEDLEQKFSKAYYELVDSADVTSLTNKERSVISLFLSHQHIRTQQFRDIVKQASERTLEIVDGEEEEEEARKVVEAGTTERGAKEWQIQLMVNALQDFADILYNMDWFLFVNKTKYPLWTSDGPIAIFNPINPEPNPQKGIEQLGSKVHVPLSTDLVLGIYDPRKYSVRDKEELTEKKHVDFQNELQVEHSHRQIYSPRKDFELAKKVIEENPEYAELDYSHQFPE